MASSAIVLLAGGGSEFVSNGVPYSSYSTNNPNKISMTACRHSMKSGNRSFFIHFFIHATALSYIGDVDIVLIEILIYMISPSNFIFISRPLYE